MLRFCNGAGFINNPSNRKSIRITKHLATPILICKRAVQCDTVAYRPQNEEEEKGGGLLKGGGFLRPVAFCGRTPLQLLQAKKTAMQSKAALGPNQKRREATL